MASLEKMHLKGVDVTQALDNSIRNSWIDVYEPKEPVRQMGSIFAGAI
jgi:hypothetical protein